MSNIIFGTLGGLSALCAVVGFIIARFHDRKRLEQESKKDGAALERISIGVESVGLEIKELKADIKELNHKHERQQELLGEQSERIARCEESTKQAHRRLDKLEARKIKD